MFDRSPGLHRLRNIVHPGPFGGDLKTLSFCPQAISTPGRTFGNAWSAVLASPRPPMPGRRTDSRSCDQGLL